MPLTAMEAAYYRKRKLWWNLFFLIPSTTKGLKWPYLEVCPNQRSKINNWTISDLSSQNFHMILDLLDPPMLDFGLEVNLEFLCYHKKYVNIPSGKYIYMYIYMCVYVYIHTYVKWMSAGLLPAGHKNGWVLVFCWLVIKMDEYRSYAGLS